MRANDADLVEVNPLAIIRESGPEGYVERLACLDAKVTLDDFKGGSMDMAATLGVYQV